MEKKTDEMQFTFPPIEPTKEFISSLVPYPKEMVEPLPIPRETKTFLTTTGLPIHSKYYFWAGDLFVFYEQLKTINFCSCGKDNFLVFGELEGYNHPTYVAVNVNRGGVYSLHRDLTVDRQPYLYTKFFNSGIAEFVQSIGCWQVFAPIVYKYEDQLWKKHIAPWDYEDILYAPFKEKLFQIDPKSIKKPRKDQMHWWPVVCCYDPGA